MDRYTGTVLNCVKTDLFKFYQKAPDLNWVWEQLNLTNLQEIEEIKETEWTELKLRAERSMKIANLTDSTLLSQKWADYMLSKETEALFIFLYSLRKDFQKEHLLIKNKEKLEELQASNNPVIFVSPHWGAFYSLPLILSSLGFHICPIANGGEEQHLNKILNTIVKEHKQNIKAVLSTKSPVVLLRDMIFYLNKNINLVIYPEYTFGPTPKYTVEYLATEFPAAQGVAKVAQMQNVKIQPVSLKHVAETSLFELEFYDTICNQDLELHVSAVNKKVHESLEKIIKKDLSKWWYWEIFEENRKGVKGEKV